MKKFIQRIVSKKRNVVIIAVLAVAVAGAGTYTLMGIKKNVQQMSAPADENNTPYYPDYPAANTAGKDAELIKRGEYLAKAGDCIACHTNSLKKGKPFAGGLPMQTPFGIIYSPNITPDKETGIGKWTDEQFINAMHKGISPDGTYYYPAFPYLYFNRMSVDDIKAIKAYLDSIPAVRQENLKNQMVWPFNQRLLQLPWRLLFFRPDQTYAVPQESEQWKRGAYLVEGPGHCAMCHSPSYHIFSDKLSLGAPIRKYNLTGTKVQGYLAPDITKKNLANVSIDEIIQVFTHDRLIGGGNVEGPMLEVNHDSLHYLTQSDLEAIATYLKSVQSKTPPKPRVGAGGAGEATYEAYCSGCHATGAGGAPKYGDATPWTPILKNGVATVYTNAIKGIGGMPAKGTCLSCSDDEIKQAVDYMIASVTGKEVRTAHAPKKLTEADSKRIYDGNCAICHETNFKNAPKPGDVQAWQPILKKGFVDIYLDVLSGRNGHPPLGACPNCSDAELKAAVKYMLNKSSVNENFDLW